VRHPPKPPGAAVAGPSPDRPATCVDVDEFRNVFTEFFGAPPDAFEFGCPRADLFARGAFGGGGAGLFGDGFGADIAPSTPSTTEAPLTLTLEELFKGVQPYQGLPYPTLPYPCLYARPACRCQRRSSPCSVRRWRGSRSGHSCHGVRVATGAMLLAQAERSAWR